MSANKRGGVFIGLSPVSKLNFHRLSRCRRAARSSTDPPECPRISFSDIYRWIVEMGRFFTCICLSWCEYCLSGGLIFVISFQMTRNLLFFLLPTFQELGRLKLNWNLKLDWRKKYIINTYTGCPNNYKVKTIDSNAPKKNLSDKCGH